MTAKIYSCLLTAVAATANDRQIGPNSSLSSKDDHSMNEDNQTETLNGDTRRVRTAGRAEDPATGTMPASHSTSSISTATGGTAATTGRKADEQARMSQQDLEITRRIRQDLVNDKDLSVRALNLAVITQGGRVVIRGSVPTSSEKDAVERIARRVSGVSSISNQVTVSR